MYLSEFLQLDYYWSCRHQKRSIGRRPRKSVLVNLLGWMIGKEASLEPANLHLLAKILTKGCLICRHIRAPQLPRLKAQLVVKHLQKPAVAWVMALAANVVLYQVSFCDYFLYCYFTYICTYETEKISCMYTPQKYKGSLFTLPIPFSIDVQHTTCSSLFLFT